MQSSTRLLRSCVAKLSLRCPKGGQMTVQFHPGAQLPALQLLPTPNGVHRGRCLGGAERTGVADTVLVHVLGITLREEAVSHRAHGPFPITWHRVRAPLMHPHAAASSPAVYPPASVSVHHSGPRRTARPQVISREVCEVAGLPPQAWHTDSPAAYFVPFQTTLTLLIKGVPTV